MFSVEEVEHMRAMNIGLDKDKLDLLILGKLSTFIARGEQTAGSKHKEVERKKMRCNYMHEGITFVLLLFFTISM